MIIYLVYESIYGEPGQVIAAYDDEERARRAVDALKNILPNCYVYEYWYETIPLNIDVTLQ